MVNPGNSTKLFCIYGNNEYLIEKEIELLKRKTSKGKMNRIETLTFRLNDSSIAQIVEAIHTRSFFSDDRIVVIKGSDKSVSKNDFERLLDAIEVQPLSSYVVIVVTDKDYIPLLKKFTLIDLTKKRNDQTVSEIINNWLRGNNIKLDDELINFLISEYQEQPNMLKMELEKLQDFLGESKNISTEDLRELVYNLNVISIYEFIRSYLNRAATRALDQLQGMRDYTDQHLKIVGALTTQLISLLKSKTPDMAKEKYFHQYQDWTIKDIVDRLARLYLIDRKFKTGTKFPFQLLESFIINN